MCRGRITHRIAAKHDFCIVGILVHGTPLFCLNIVFLIHYEKVIKQYL